MHLHADVQYRGDTPICSERKINGSGVRTLLVNRFWLFPDSHGVHRSTSKGLYTLNSVFVGHATGGTHSPRYGKVPCSTSHGQCGIANQVADQVVGPHMHDTHVLSIQLGCNHGDNCWLEAVNMTPSQF